MRAKKEVPFCAGDDHISLSCRELAAALGIKWDTVRQRRYRGWSWSEAINPKLRRSTFNDHYKPKK